MAVRAPTTVAGVRSRTATLMSRYGRPHTTDIKMKRAIPRLVTGPSLFGRYRPLKRFSPNTDTKTPGCGGGAYTEG